jgi:hypothetical protein
MNTNKDLSISPVRANLYALPLGLLAIGLLLIPYVAIWGINSAFDLTWLVEQPLKLVLALFILFIGTFIHEALHAIGWKIFGRQPWNTIQFGIFWKVLTPYTHLKAPIEVNAYRIGGALPGLVTGVLPYLVGLCLGSAAWLWLGLLMVAAACGDLLALWLVRRLPAGTMVQDHPSRVGCNVVE